MKLTSQTQALAEVFDGETGAIAAEVVYSFETEFARTLTDCLMRRTMVGLNSELGVGADEAAAKIAQEHLGWSAERARNEVRAHRSYITRFQI
jgi:glycerol-3-phosphate dehydrogenase